MGKYAGQADIIIKNGRIIDGTGNPYYYADIAIKQDKIAAIGDLSVASAPLIIDAAGKLVTPGFIDSHSHSDATVWVNPECQSTVRQGVTTEIVGNCGMMSLCSVQGSFPGPSAHDPGEPVSIYDADPPAGSFSGVFDKLEKLGVSENFAWYCGHNKLRQIAGIRGADYTEAQFAVMEKNLREALDSGYIGLSTGLEFQPGKLARPEEIERLAAVVKEYDGIYASHTRNRDSAVYESTEEFLNVIRRYRIRGVYSHLNIRDHTGAPENALRKTIRHLHEVRDQEGLNVVTDMIPSLYGIGQMRALLPDWVTANGWDEARKILSDLEKRKILRTSCDRYWRFIHSGDWWRVRVQYAPRYPEIAGLTFPDLAKLWNQDEWACFFDILAAAETQDEAEQCIMLGKMFTEIDIADSITDPLFMWVADGYTTVDQGPLAEITAVPKHYMDIMYFFTHHVRDQKNISIEKAISKVSSYPATFYRLTDRGLIAEGYYADINVFSLDELKTRATFDRPCVYSEGMHYVIVNGIPVIAEGEHTHARPGRVLKHQ